MTLGITDSTGYPVVKQLYPGNRISLQTLASAAFIQDNRGTAQGLANTTLSDFTPKGVLAGSVAGVTGDNEVGAASGTVPPVGIFLGNAQGAPFENNSAVGSGKIAYMAGAGSVMGVEVYETRNAADTGNLAYSAGQLLYTSARGLLTNETTDSTVIIARVLSAPSGSDKTMVVQLAI